MGARERDFLATYSHEVTLLHLGDENAPPGAVAIKQGDLSLEGDDILLAGVSGPRTFDHLYLALGCLPQNQLAKACGAGCDEVGMLVLDAHQMTTLPGFYAAGDVSRGINQISVAAGEAAIAATAIHKRLRERDTQA